MTFFLLVFLGSGAGYFCFFLQAMLPEIHQMFSGSLTEVPKGMSILPISSTNPRRFETNTDPSPAGTHIHHLNSFGAFFQRALRLQRGLCVGDGSYSSNSVDSRFSV
jgi:hypothetical protein